MSTVTKNRTKRTTKKSKPETYSKLHMIIPVEDMSWALQQKPAVYKLWGECWRSDPYGSRMMQLNTELPYSTFMSAKKAVKESGLFVFERKTSILDGRETVCWQTRNLHGARVKQFWQPVSRSSESNSHQREFNSDERESNSHQRESISSKTPAPQSFQEASVTSQKHFRNSSKEFLKCKPDEVSTAILSLGDTLPEAPAQEKLPALSKSDIHEILRAAEDGVCPSKSAIAAVLETEYAASLMHIINANSQWEVQLTSLSPQNEGVRLRSQLRDSRKKQLGDIASNPEMPSIDFLQECCGDPVLLMTVKKLINSHPEWNLIWDGELIILSE